MAPPKVRGLLTRSKACLCPTTGKILTIETLPLRTPRKMWSGPDHVNPDQTYFGDEYLHHILYITRIYFVYGQSDREFIGKRHFALCFVSTTMTRSFQVEIVTSFSDSISQNKQNKLI